MSNKLFHAVILALFFLKISGPLQATNLIFNSSFENCTNPGIPDGYGWEYFGAVREKLPTYTLVDFGVTSNNAYHGKVSFQTSSGLFFQVYTSIKIDKPHVLSAYVKAEKPDSKIMFGQRNAGWGIKDSFVVGTNWQRISVTISATNKTAVFIVGQNLSGGKVCWDALQLEEGMAPTEYSPVSPVDENMEVRLKGKGTNVPVYKIGRANIPPRIDGILDDACWSNQTLISFPSPKDGAKARTEAIISHDDANVYFAVICHEPEMAKILAKYTNHDDSVYADDSVELFIDTQNYHYSDYNWAGYQHFMMNALGTKAEERMTFLGGRQWDWNAGWEGVARKESDRWIAEIAIPYSTLGTMRNFPETWGINICRSRSHAKEFVPWYGRYHAPETFPQVQGICPKLVRIGKAGAWSFSLDEKSGKLVISYPLINYGAQPVKTRSKITVYVGDSQEGKVYQGEEKELTGSKPVVYAFPVKYASKDKTLRFKVEAFDLEGKRLFLSGEESLNVADLIDGPGPEYELYLSGEKEMNCWFDLARAAQIPNLEMEYVVRDLFHKEYNKTRMPIKGSELRLTIPMKKIPLGSNRLEVRLMRGNEIVAERVILFRRLPPPARGTVIRIDRWHRVLMVNNRPFIGFGTGAPSIGCSKDAVDLYLKDYKKHGANMLYFWHAGRGLDEVGLWLDAAEAHGMKMTIYLGDYLYKRGRAPRLMQGGKSYLELLDSITAMVKKYSSHPALLNWDLMDEPADDNVPQVEAVYCLLRELDPYHPVTLNVNDASRGLRWWNTVMDIPSNDHYPIPEGLAQAVAISASEMEPLLAGRPLRYWIQSYGGCEGKTRDPTPRELKSMTYMTAIYGCSQFLYFGIIPMSPDLYAMWGECANELDQISNALAAPARQHLTVRPEDNAVCASWRKYDDEAMIITVNKSEDAQTVEIKLPDTCRADAADVLFEERKVKIENGLLRDSFQGLERHVYRLKNQ